MRHFIEYRMATIISVLFLVALLSGCQDSEVEQKEIVPKVKVFTVGKEATGQLRRISGKVSAATTATLSFGVSGKVVEIVPNEGGTVSDGQLLARIDSQPVRIRLEDARAQLNSARAKLVEAQSGYTRTSKLFSQRGASQKELDAAMANLTTTKNNVDTAKGKVTQAELDYSHVRLAAPFAGKVEKVEVDLFEEITAGQKIITIQAADALEVKVRVPESLIRFVDYGQLVQATFPALPDVMVPGVITSISAEAEEGNAFPVSVSLSENNADLRSGMTAGVSFNFSSYLDGRKAYLIPLSAIAIESGYLNPKAFNRVDSAEETVAPVFVFDQTAGQIHEKKVVVGELRGNEIEVYEGLEKGELVVSAGVAFLRDGMQAEVWNPKEFARR